MGLFKILRGDSSRISTSVTPFHDGYAYLTPDDGGFYIDAISGGVEKRIHINPSLNNQTPTYTIATSNETLTSGEKLNVAMGKIARAVLSLISHLADSVTHITAAERAAWNAKVPDTRKVNGKALDGDITLTASDVGAVAASSQKASTLTASGWSATAPYSQVLSVSGLTATSNGNVAIAQTATVAQRKTAREALMSVTAQEDGKLTITADGKKPETDIPVLVTIGG